MSSIAALILLSPIVVFLMVTATEVLIDGLMDAGVSGVRAVAAAAIGWTLFGTLRPVDRPAGYGRKSLRDVHRSREAWAITGAPVAISLEPGSPFQAFNGRSPVWRSRSSRNGS